MRVPVNTRRGITVLSLLLLIIGLLVVGFFLVRYVRTRPTVTRPVSVLRMRSGHQPLDQLNLSGVIQVVSGNTVDLLRVGPHALG
jgi:hypothetical protein